jgi:hypothetical protein
MIACLRSQICQSVGLQMSSLRKTTSTLSEDLIDNRKFSFCDVCGPMESADGKVLPKSIIDATWKSMTRVR